MKDAEYYKLRITGRIDGHGKKLVSLMNVSKEIIKIKNGKARFTDSIFFSWIKKCTFEQFERLAEKPVPIQQMEIADVMTFKHIVNEEDIESGMFEGLEVGDITTEEITFGMWPVELEETINERTGIFSIKSR